MKETDHKFEHQTCTQQKDCGLVKCRVEPLFKKRKAETTKNRSIIDLNSFVKGRKIERICPGFW